MSELNSAMSKRAAKEEPKKEEPKKAAAAQPAKTVGKATGAKVAAAAAPAPAAAAPAASSGGGGGGGKKELVVARHDYLGAQEDDELSFSGDDVITVVKKDNSGWWQGELRDQIGWFPSTFVRPMTREEEAALGGEDEPAPAPAATKAVAKKAAAAAEKAPAATAAKAGTAAKVGAAKTATPAPAATTTAKAPGSAAAAAPAVKTVGSSGGLKAAATAKKEETAPAAAAAAAPAVSNPAGWNFLADFDKVASTLLQAWSKSCAAKGGQRNSAGPDGSAAPAVVVFGSPSHCASEGTDSQSVSLQECAAALLRCSDIKTAAAQLIGEGDGQLAGLLRDFPALTVSRPAYKTLKAGCSSAYAAAAAMEPPLNEALATVLALRATSSTLRGIAQVFLGLGDGSWFGSNGLSVWVVKGKLAVVAFHPAVDKEVSVVGKAFGVEVNKIK